MLPTSLHDLEAHELSSAIRRRRVSPVEILDAVFERIAALNPVLNAYLRVFEESARAAARRAERAVKARKPLGAMHGLPVSIKDIILTTEAPTTAGSKIFGEGLLTDHDAPVVRRLRRAGAIIIGKTNLHEVALGVTSANEHFGPVRNPWDTTRVAGGSSGGSAVAVAAGLGPLSVGSDTRGSIRIPAACCGITGLKPTRGLVSTADVVPLSATLDHLGPMARSATDCALLLGAMAGSRSAGRPQRGTGRSLRKLRVGVSEYHLRDLDASVQQHLDSALRELRRLGCRMKPVDAKDFDGVQEASVIISSSEAVAYHDPMLRANPEAYGPLVRARLEGGYQRTALEYLRALASRERVAAVFERLFTEVDCLVGATLPALPPRIGEQVVQINGRETNVIDSFTRLNSPQNMAGVPAMSLPCGFSPGSLPVGLQLIAPLGGDEMLLSLGMAYQRETDWHRRQPPVH
jgi:aspartyl-tRNA(Asn)/glutamyl-tRNA(Gln) amidotransferase subunit A